MRIVVLGSGSPIPYDERVQSGFLLEKDQRFLLVDCGSGVLYRLGTVGVDLKHIHNILLTHHHLDHMSDLLPLLKARWLLGATVTSIYGPKGTAKLVTSLLALFPYLEKEITINIQDLSDGDALKIANVIVEVIEVKHLVPTLAYKFDNKVVISGDTEPLSKIRDFAKDCVVFHECSLPNGFEATGHSSPRELGKVVSKSRIKTLILTHFYPSILHNADKIAEEVRNMGFNGEVIVAKDMDTFIV